MQTDRLSDDVDIYLGQTNRVYLRLTLINRFAQTISNSILPEMVFS